MTDLFIYVSAIEQAWRDELQSTNRPRYIATHTYASQFRTCTREMCLDLTNPEDEPPRNDDALERMARGRERGSMLVDRLRRIGRRCERPFEVVENEARVSVRDRDGIEIISGKLDLRIRFESGPRPVCEIKSGQVFERVNRLEDLDDSPWTEHAIDQLLAYLYAEKGSEPFGILIIDRPSMPLLLPVSLEDHLERVERMLQQARTAHDWASGKLKVLPDFTKNQSTCRRCSHFGKSCAPPWSYGEGVRMIADPEIADAIDVVVRTRDAAREHDRAKEILKKSLRGVENAIVDGGPGKTFRVEGEWGKNTLTILPDEAKRQYTITDPKGKFTLSYERIEETAKT